MQALSKGRGGEGNSDFCCSSVVPLILGPPLEEAKSGEIAILISMSWSQGSSSMNQKTTALCGVGWGGVGWGGVGWGGLGWNEQFRAGNRLEGRSTL